jgi:hypothetical protein
MLQAAPADLYRSGGYPVAKMKEPITIKGYSSPRTFHLFDVSWSGSCVLFHGFGGMFVGDAIDLITDTKERFAAQFDKSKKDLENMIGNLVDWVRQTLKEHERISILGL